MHRIPRDLSGKELAKALDRCGYRVARETGSHIRLTQISKQGEHKITIPDHESIRIGTLNNILNEVAEHLGISKQDLLNELFGQNR